MFHAASLLLQVILLFLLLLAAVSDVRYGRIPNRLTGAGVLLRLLLLSAIGFQWEPAVLPAAALILFLCMLLFCIRALGAGDVKLIMLVLFWFPNRTGLMMLQWTLPAAGIWSLLILVKRRLFRDRIRHLTAFLSAGSEGISYPYYLADRDGKAAVLPLAAPLFAGALLAVAGVPFPI